MRPAAGRGPVTGLAALAAVLLLPAAAWAAPAWLEPFPVSSLENEAHDSVVAMGPRGDVLLAWVDDGRIHARFRPAGGVLGPPKIFPEPPASNASEVAAAVDADGNAVVIWRGGDPDPTGVDEAPAKAAFRPVGGAFDDGVRISEPNHQASQGEVAFDAQGTATAVFTSYDYGADLTVVQRAVRPAGGSFGPVDTISAPDAIGEQAQLGVTPAGDAFAAWLDDDDRLWGASRPAGGEFAAPEQVSGDDPAFTFDLAMNAAGAVLLAWTRQDADFGVRAALRAAGQSPFAPVFDLDDAGDPAAALDAQGNAVLAFTFSLGASDQAYASFRPAAGAFEVPGKELSDGTNSASDLAAAFDASGGAIVAFDDGEAMRVARRDVGAAEFAQPQNVAPSAVASNSQSPFLDVDDAGNAVVAWEQALAAPDDDLDVIATGYDGAGPLLDGLSIPASGAAGSPLAFSMAPLDVWSAVASSSFDFGDGTTAPHGQASHAYGAPGSYTVTAAATDSLANVTRTSRTVEIPDSVRPRVSRLRLSPRRFRAAPRGPSIAAPVGSRVRFRLSEAARVRFTVERAAPGRRSGRRCRKPSRRNRGGRRCTRYVKLPGSFRRAGEAGANSFRFTGRLRGRKLRARRYRLVARATDEAGNVSPPRRAKFRIVKR